MSILVPARNSQHRAACFALYRALLRSARDIKVSVDHVPERVDDPIRWLIRGQFKRNRKDVSPRLVYSSLSAGYKFLDLFSKAKVSGSPEHASVTEHVQTRLRDLEAWRARQPTKEPRQPLPPALLTRLPPKTDNPDEPPVYTSHLLPRPKSALRGARQVPRLCATASGIPFLRFKKPQPEALTKRLLSLNFKAQERADALVHMKEDLVPEAALEDGWEKAMGELARREGRGRRLTREEEELARGDGGVTFGGCLHGARVKVQEEMTRVNADNIARARAMLEIVKKEKALAAEEAREAAGAGRATA